MGLYIRKAIRVGPFRFNLSKSGVGVSAGVRGLRLGAGPTGNYVHMGRGGVYYRKTLPSGTSGKGAGSPWVQPEASSLPPDEEPLTEIESGDVAQMVDSSSADLLAEMNGKRKKLRLWPIVAVVGLVMSGFVFTRTDSAEYGLLLLLVTAVGVFIAAVRDGLRKSTVLFFKLEPEIERLYQGLHDAFARVAACDRKWHVEAEGAVKDRKRNAGASSVIRRNAIFIGLGNAPDVKTNIAVPSIPVGRQTLYFFPDKVLVFEPKGVGAVSYHDLRIAVEESRFVEDGRLPADANVVDQTWRYVNKNGGPDKRFKDNFALPITLYEDLDFASATGLNERIQLSKVGTGDELRRAIQALAAGV